MKEIGLLWAALGPMEAVLDYLLRQRQGDAQKPADLLASVQPTSADVAPPVWVVVSVVAVSVVVGLAVCAFGVFWEVKYDDRSETRGGIRDDDRHSGGSAPDRLVFGEHGNASGEATLSFGGAAEQASRIAEVDAGGHHHLPRTTPDK